MAWSVQSSFQLGSGGQLSGSCKKAEGHRRCSVQVQAEQSEGGQQNILADKMGGVGNLMGDRGQQALRRVPHKRVEEKPTYDATCWKARDQAQIGMCRAPVTIPSSRSSSLVS